MSIAKAIIEVLEFYSEASPQAMLDDRGERASELLDKLHPNDPDDPSSLHVIEESAFDSNDPEVHAIIQEFEE